MNTPSRLAAGLMLAAAVATASAQTPQPLPASQPAPVAVTPETARAADAQAVPRSDTATVVRTGPTAADKTRQLKSDVKTSATEALAADGTPMAANHRGNKDSTAMRAPRADRH